MAKSKKAAKALTPAQEAAREALQITWALKGNLKNDRMSFIRVAAKLALVRDKKLYAALHHPNMENYAEERLSLSRRSLYRYLRVYDWVAQFHKEWIAPKPKGFLPDLSDIDDLMWIERELTKKNLDPKKRAQLEALRQKGLEGKLRTSDLRDFRRRGGASEASLRSLLSTLRALRKRAARLVGAPPELIAHLDAAIATLSSARAVKLAMMELPGAARKTSFVPSPFFATRSKAIC